MAFLETIFANLPYKSVERYIETEGGMVPEIVPSENDSLLHENLERYLPEFTRDYCGMDFEDEDAIDSALFDFGLSFFRRNKNDKIWLSISQN